jgi:hypothetical protein
MRRRYLRLLLALIPAILGAGTAAFIWLGEEPLQQEAPSAPRVSSPALQTQPEQPVAESASDRSAVAAEAGAGSAMPETRTQPNESSKPNAEALPAAPLSRPVQIESDEVIGVPLFASAELSQSTLPDRAIGGSLRVASAGSPASVGAGGAGAPARSKEVPQTGVVDSTEDLSTVDGESTSDPSHPPTTHSAPGNTTDPQSTYDAGNTPHPQSTDDAASTHDTHNEPLVQADVRPPVVQVPEPASFGLLLLGLLGCCARRRHA